MYTLKKGTALSTKVIKDAIEWNEEQKKMYIQADDYYKGDHQITEREKPKGLKNNKIVINHPKYITKINVGYFLGNPVEYVLQGKDAKNKKYQTILDEILEAYKKQTIKDLDKKLAKDDSKYGVAYEYIFANSESEPVSSVINPKNCILVRDDSMDHAKMFAIVYEAVKRKSKDDEDAKYIGVWTVDDRERLTYDEDLNKVGSADHAIGEVPVVEYLNNDDRIGDYYDVISLVDAYNLLCSDRVNDKEALVDSLLILYGVDLTDDQIRKSREQRTISVPPKTKGTEVTYVTKELNEEQLEILKKSIVDDIHKISMTPNMTDENFVGNSSGVAIRFKLLPFELNVQDKETAFERGLMERMSLYNKYLNKTDQTQLLPIYNVDAVFKRSLPQNDYETSQMILNLMGKVSDESLISQLSFVQDASAELEKRRQEIIKYIQGDNPNYGENKPNEGEDEEIEESPEENPEE